MMVFVKAGSWPEPRTKVKVIARKIILQNRLNETDTLRKYKVKIYVAYQVFFQRYLVLVLIYCLKYSITNSIFFLWTYVHNEIYITNPPPPHENYLSLFSIAIEHYSSPQMNMLQIQIYNGFV